MWAIQTRYLYLYYITLIENDMFDFTMPAAVFPQKHTSFVIAPGHDSLAAPFVVLLTISWALLVFIFCWVEMILQYISGITGLVAVMDY
jgi:hypothetical protein